MLITQNLRLVINEFKKNQFNHYQIRQFNYHLLYPFDSIKL